MLISNVLGGFSLNEADNLRKAMGKKKPEVMEKFGSVRRRREGQNGCDPRSRASIWERS
jgi:DNA polymerase-3 subunit alpha